MAEYDRAMVEPWQCMVQCDRLWQSMIEPRQSMVELAWLMEDLEAFQLSTEER